MGTSLNCSSCLLLKPPARDTERTFRIDSTLSFFLVSILQEICYNNIFSSRTSQPVRGQLHTANVITSQETNMVMVMAVSAAFDLGLLKSSDALS